MIRLISLSILIFIYCSPINAQNLIANGDFEVYDTCPNNNAQVNRCVGWYPLLNTPDYFNCNFNGIVPQSYAYSGLGYMGMLGGTTLVPNKVTYNELIKTKLNSPVIKGKKYLLQFQLGLGFFYDPVDFVDFGLYFYPKSKPLPYSGYANICLNEIPQILINTLSLKKYAYTYFRYCFEATEDFDSLAIGPFCNNKTISSTTTLTFYMLDDLKLTELKEPKIQLSDSVICKNEIINYDPLIVEGFSLLEWVFDGGSPQTSQDLNPINISYNTPGVYDVKLVLTDGCEIDTFLFKNKVTVIDDSIQILTQTSILKCFDKKTIIKLNEYPYKTILWNTGETTKQITASNAGLYYCDVTTKCSAITDSINVIDEVCACNIYIPNSFTPNGDGINDYLKIYGDGELLNVSIYNKFGQEIFYAENNNFNWNGTFNNDLVKEDVYVYKIVYRDCNQKHRVKNGLINILY